MVTTCPVPGPVLRSSRRCRAPIRLALNAKRDANLVVFRPRKLLRGCRKSDSGEMTHIDQDLSDALYLLGFTLLRGDLGEIAEIKGEMTIKLVHPPGEELKFVVELPDDKQMTFSVASNRRLDRALKLRN